MTHPVAYTNLHLWIGIFEVSIQEIGNLYAFQEWFNLMKGKESTRPIRPGDFYYNNFKNCHLIWIIAQNKIKEFLKE